MLKLETLDDIQSLIDRGIDESLTLEFKASDALSRDDKKRAELAKDVSAFANSAGGQIVFGLAEAGKKPPHKAASIDAGVDGSVISKEWIEQVITSNIFPIIEGVRIKPILRAAPNKFVYVISIPQATGRAPHQASDRKYYRRHEFTSIAMHDYEIRDIFRRATTPILNTAIQFDRGMRTPVRTRTGAEVSDGICLHVGISNKANQPAEFTSLTLLVDAELEVLSAGPFKNVGCGEHKGMLFHFLTVQIGPPKHFPIFKEMQTDVTGEAPVMVGVRTRGKPLGEFNIHAIIRTPGFEAEQSWAMTSLMGYADLVPTG